MTERVRVVVAGEQVLAGLVGMPIAHDDQGLLVPQGLPASFAGVAIPSEIDTEWAASQGFDANPGQALAIREPGRPTLVLLGIGDAASADADVWRRVGAAAARAAAKATTLAILLPLPSTIRTDGAAQALVEGSMLASTRSGSSKSTPDVRAPLDVVIAPVASDGVSDEEREQVDAGVAAGIVIADAVCWARDLINRPAAQLTPRRLAHEALRRLEDDPHMDEAAAARCGVL